MNMEKRGRRAAESESIIFYTELKIKKRKKKEKKLTAITVFSYFISSKKGELKFPEITITENQGVIFN